MLKYEIISTGSKGNCVIIEDTMIDIGVPQKKIKEHLYSIKTLLLTHIHSDHIKESTLKYIVTMFPHIEIFGNYEVAQYFGEYPIKVVNADFSFESAGKVYIPFKLTHDVVTYGYTWTLEDKSIIYATDTSDLEHAPIMKYDYFFLENNYDVNKLLQLATTRKYGYNVVMGAKRHLSTQDAKAFFYMNRRDKDAVLIPLHMSSRFY